MAELTVAEASRILGLSAATIKRRLVSGELIGRKEPRPQGSRWLVEVNTDHIKVNPPLTDSSRTQFTDNSELTMIAWLQEELTARRREISELHVLLQTAQAALTTPERRPWWRLWK